MQKISVITIFNGVTAYLSTDIPYLRNVIWNTLDSNQFYCHQHNNNFVIK